MIHDHGGSWRELASAARRAALAPLPGWQVFACEGRDAVDLLGRLSTNDLAPLASGRAVTTLFLTPTGRIRHRVLLLPSSGGLLALAEPGSDGFPAWIDGYTFAEDCRIVPVPRAAFAVFGPEALRAAPAPLERGGDVAEADGWAWARRDWGGSLPAAFALAPAADSEATAPPGADALPRLGAEALLQLRVESGEPAAGAELSEERFPLEAGLLAEISFTKGCYTGQEVVARQDTYGKVARRLVGLLLDDRPQPGEEIPAEGRACAVTSVAPDRVGAGDGERVAALAYVASRSAAPGTEVTTASGLVGRVTALPLP